MRNEKNILYQNTYKYGEFKNNLGCQCILENINKKKYEFIIYDGLNHKTQEYSENEYVIEVRKKMKK
jgi:hypothetical protein